MHVRQLETRMAHLEGAYEQSNERLASMDRRLDAIDRRFNWVIGLILLSWLTIIGMQITTFQAVLQVLHK